MYARSLRTQIDKNAAPGFAFHPSSFSGVAFCLHLAIIRIQKSRNPRDAVISLKFTVMFLSSPVSTSLTGSLCINICCPLFQLFVLYHSSDAFRATLFNLLFLFDFFYYFCHICICLPDICLPLCFIALHLVLLSRRLFRFVLTEWSCFALATPEIL